MPLWLSEQPLVLASRSEARGKILAAAGLPFEVRPAELDERAVEGKLGPSDAVAAARLLARAKAETVAKTAPGRLVLGADQTLARGDRRFSKPTDRADAAEQLRALRGRTHELHSALTLMIDGDVLFSYVGIARLTMRDFNDLFLDDYLDMAGNHVLASVGGYQLEGIGIHLFEHVEGDHFTILGLPLVPLLTFLREKKFIAG
jgi:septum formation protein